MNELQQVLGGGLGAMVFYLLYKVVDLIREYFANKGQRGKDNKDFCTEHGAMCVHLETIRSDVGEIKGHVMQIVRDVAELQGRVSS